MRFNRKGFKPSIFTEVMTSTDTEIFRTAFDGKPVRSGLQVGACRDHVRDVIHLWADKLNIPFSIAVQSFITGKPDALKAHYVRQIPRAEVLLEEATKSLEPPHIREMYVAEATKLVQWLKSFQEFDVANMNDYVREPWVWALSIKPPFIEFKNAKRTNVHAVQTKIGDGAKPKARKAPNKGKVIVEHKKIAPKTAEVA
jgi:hypothetical protein